MKGMLTAAIRDDNPVICFEHRWLYWAEEDVPEEPYEIPLGVGRILRPGKDVTVVGLSWMNVEARLAADILQKRGVSVEIIDPRTLAPLDEDLIVDSVKRTGRCIIADCDWVDSGFSAELSARVNEKCFGKLKAPVKRIGFAHTPCPTVREPKTSYPNARRSCMPSRYAGLKVNLTARFQPRRRFRPAPDGFRAYRKPAQDRRQPRHRSGTASSWPPAANVAISRSQERLDAQRRFKAHGAKLALSADVLDASRRSRDGCRRSRGKRTSGQQWAAAAAAVETSRRPSPCGARSMKMPWLPCASPGGPADMRRGGADRTIT
jgi:hypothetical protein